MAMAVTGLLSRRVCSRLPAQDGPLSCEARGALPRQQHTTATTTQASLRKSAPSSSPRPTDLLLRQQAMLLCSRPATAKRCIATVTAASTPNQRRLSSTPSTAPDLTDSNPGPADPQSASDSATDASAVGTSSAQQEAQQRGISSSPTPVAPPAAVAAAAASRGARVPAVAVPSHPDLPYSLLTFLSLLGASETAYLTYEKLFNGPISCPFGGGCGDVLDSPYGSLFGLPLALYGCVSYSAVALLTQIARINESRGILEDNVRWLLLALTSVMVGTSAYLMYILSVELDSAFCAYCFASAGLTVGLLLATLQGFTRDEVKRAVLPQLGLLAATVVALSTAFGDARSAVAGVQDIDLPPVEAEVTTVSTPLGVQLAKHLSNVGAKMYGAFWCSHCHDQKQAFGQEAVKYLPYVECYPEGYRRGVRMAQACLDANIEGFPTWIIGGEMRPGEQDLEELARITGFQATIK